MTKLCHAQLDTHDTAYHPKFTKTMTADDTKQTILPHTHTQSVIARDVKFVLSEIAFCFIAKLIFFQILFHILGLLVTVMCVMCSGSKCH